MVLAVEKVILDFDNIPVDRIYDQLFNLLTPLQKLSIIDQWSTSVLKQNVKVKHKYSYNSFLNMHKDSKINNIKTAVHIE